MSTTNSAPLSRLINSTLLKRVVRGNPEKQRYLFLLSHMRSYSSVLAHVLGSSPDIDGYGETHIKYRSKLDLWRLQRVIQQSTGQPIRGEWLLDKILHNYVHAPDRLINDEQSRVIIFLRRPERTLQSILTLANTQPTDAATHDPQLNCEYYISRLHRLRVDGQRLGQRSLYFDAEAFINQPTTLLAALSDWLGLSTALQPDYRISHHTGEAGFGDPLHNIQAGRILDSSASTIANNLCIPLPLLREAEAAYQGCRESLLRSCQYVVQGLCQ